MTIPDAVPPPAGICYFDHTTGESDHMHAHIHTAQCDKPTPPPAALVTRLRKLAKGLHQRGDYAEQRAMNEAADALQAAEQKTWNPAADGCSGLGRPSCKATECMFGLDKNLQLKRWSCAFTDEVIPELPGGLCQMSDEYRKDMEAAEQARLALVQERDLYDAENIQLEVAFTFSTQREATLRARVQAVEQSMKTFAVHAYAPDELVEKINRWRAELTALLHEETP